MDEEVKRRVIDSFESSIRLVAPLDIEQALSAVRKLTSFAQARLEGVKTREDLAAMLDAIPLDDSQEQLLIGAMEQLPLVLRMFVMELSARAMKQLPELPRGRRSEISTDDAMRICEFIGLMQAKGCDMKSAKERAARKFGVSKATIQRVWSARKQPKLRPADLQKLVDQLLE